MQFDRNKLKAVVLYTISRCEPSKLGAVKLHKVLYYSDMLRYADTGNSITGAIYRKRPFGPTCEQLQSMISEAVEQNLITVRSVSYFGYVKKEYKVTNIIEFDELSGDEINLIEEVINFVCHENSAKSISDLSHGRPWESVEFGEEIRYNSVYHMFPAEVSAEAIDWASQQVDDIANTKSSSDPVDYVDFASFRSKVLEERKL